VESGSEVLADFRQSDFFGQPFGLDTLRKKAMDHRPTLNRQGLVNQRALTLMTGDRSLQEISRQLLAEFPEEFGSESEADASVAILSERFSA